MAVGTAVIYDGGERGHADTGNYRVHIRFHWPDGLLGSHDYDPEPLADAEIRLRFYGMGVPAIVSEGTGPSGIHHVRVERAWLEPA